MNRTISAGALALALALTARAEVRVVESSSGLDLQVRPVAGGIWTSRAIGDSGIVNPEGDQSGDGYPSHATAARRLVAAWTRPSHGTLAVLVHESGGRGDLREIAAGSSASAPTVTRWREGWLIAWQEGSIAPEVHATYLDDQGQLSARLVLRGSSLVATLGAGDALHVFTLDAQARSLIDTRLVLLATAPHVPVPIPTTERSIVLFPMGTSPVTGLTTCTGARDGGSVLAWTVKPGEVGRVVLPADDSDRDAEYLRGPSGSCQAILNAVERATR